MATVTAQDAVAVRYRVRGMTCASCAARAEAALMAVPGVRSARVDPRSGTARVWQEEPVALGEQLEQAVARAGYSLEPFNIGERPSVGSRPIPAGGLAALGLLAFYLGLATLAQGWGHAVQLFAEDRWFVIAIATGFGVQIGLFVHLRQLHARATARGVAASSGTSTAAMLACCLHHLSDVLPIVGLSGAALFLGAYKTQILWFGVVASLGGAVYMANQVRRHQRSDCHTPAQAAQE